MKLYVAKTRKLKNGYVVEGFKYKKNPTPKNDFDNYYGVYVSAYLKNVKDLNVSIDNPLNLNWDKDLNSYVLVDNK